MLLMRAMDGYAFPAAAVVPAGLPAGAVVPIGVRLPEPGDKLLLKRKPRRPVSPAKGRHRFLFLFVILDFHREHLSRSPAAAVVFCSPLTCPDRRCGHPRCSACSLRCPQSPFFQGANFTASSFTSGILAKSGTSTVTITVTDSRGRTASTTRNITVAAYAAPKITSSQGFRRLADGTENYEGTYVKVALNFAISPVGDKNMAAYTVEYKLQSASTWTALTSGSVYAFNDSIISASGLFGVDNSFDIRLSVTDYFGTVRSTFEIPTAFTLLDFNNPDERWHLARSASWRKALSSDFRRFSVMRRRHPR